MSFIKQIRKAARDNKKSNVQKALIWIKERIETVANDGDTSVEIRLSGYGLTDAEKGRVQGTLKRMGFRIRREFNYNTSSIFYIVSWR